MITEKTVLAWLRKHGATIQPPTRERERVLHFRWERERVREIESLRKDVESLEKRYGSCVDEMMINRGTSNHLQGVFSIRSDGMEIH